MAGDCGWRSLLCFSCLLAAALTAESRTVEVRINAEQPRTQCTETCTGNGLGLWGFRAGSIVSYDYKSLAVNTIQGLTADASGIKFKMTLVFVFHTPCWVEMTIKNVRVFDYNGTWPMTSRKDYTLNVKLSEVYSDSLTQWSTWFQWDDGEVRCIEWGNEEPLWVQNFKRGLLSPWQLNLKEKSFWQTAVTGHCRVSQNWAWQEDSIDVHQVRHMSECQERPNRVTSTMGFNPTHQVTDSTFYSHASTSWYRLWNVSSTGWVFKNITVEDQHSVYPFSKHGGGAVTFVRQAYLWKSGPEVGETKPFSKTLCEKPCSSLLYQYPEEKLSVSENECSDSVKHQIKALIHKLWNNFDRPEEIGYGKMFLTLVWKVRCACPAQLMALWKHFANLAQYQQREIYLDAMGVACTEDSITFLKDRILAGEIELSRAKALLTDMNFCNRSSSVIVKAVKELSNGVSAIYDNWSIQCEAWLGLGSHVHRLGVEETTSKDAVKYLRATVMRIYSEWGFAQQRLKSVNKATQASLWEAVNRDITAAEEKITCAMSALGNSGSPSGFKALWMIAQERDLPTDIRSKSIWAMKHLALTIPRQIQMQLTLLWQSTAQPTEVRVAAWDILMETINDLWPVSWFDYIHIVEGLRNEPNHWVGSYAWSWLNAWADHQELDEQKARFAQYSLQASGAWYWGLKYALGYHSSKFAIASVSLADAGLHLPVGAAAVFMTTKVIFTGESTLPRSASADLYVLFLGQKIPLLTMQGSADGASWMLEHLFGPIGYFATNKSKEWEPTGCLNWNDRQCKPFVKKGLFADLAISVLGHELRHWTYDQSWFQQKVLNSPFYNMTDLWWSMFTDRNEGWTWNNSVNWLQRWREFNIWNFLANGTIWNSVWNFNKTMLPLEMKMSNPTILGLPSFLSAEMVSHVSVETEGRVFHGKRVAGIWDHIWKLLDIWNPAEYHGYAAIHPRMNFVICASMGVDAVYGGAKVQFDMDLSSNNEFAFDFSIRPDSYQLSSRGMLDSENDLMSYKTEIGFKTWAFEEKWFWPIIGHLDVTEGYDCLGKEYLGIEVCFWWNGYNSSGTWAPYYPLNGPSFGKLKFLTGIPMDRRLYKNDCSEKYLQPPSSFVVTLRKNDAYNFSLWMNGEGANPERNVTVHWWRENLPDGVEIWTDITWSAWMAAINHTVTLSPIQSFLRWSWNAVRANWWILGEMSRSSWETFGELNRTHASIKGSYWSHEKWEDKCHWAWARQPSQAYQFWANGSLWRRSSAQLSAEVNWNGDWHWANASASVNQLMSDWKVDYGRWSWNFGVPLPHPIDWASCQLFSDDVITFDGLHYQLAANGSFVLAQCDWHKNFSVIVTRRSYWVESLELHTGCHSYTIRPNCQLSIDGVRRKLPYWDDVLKTAECWGNITRIITTTGLQIYYRPEAVEVSVNGFFYKHTRGLCGNNNNRGSREDEWQLSTCPAALASTAAEFIESWGVKNVAMYSAWSGEETSVGEKACRKAIWSDVMEPISRELDLEPYFDSCVALVEREKTKGVWPAICEVVRGISLAAFSRDFDLYTCWYGEWSGWKIWEYNLVCRRRELQHSCSDDCDLYQMQCRENVGFGIDLHRCRPHWREYVTESMKRKLCVSEKFLPSCPPGCHAVFGKESLYMFHCIESSRWPFEHVYSAPVVPLAYSPPDTCFCYSPCDSYKDG
eukprot:m.3001 g.3001  ORF g.3001 m.3001 type:complete len:1684 (+) comp9003_c0_seq2:144-5195(+)